VARTIQPRLFDSTSSLDEVESFDPRDRYDIHRGHKLPQ
jgi:hypothetical protein